MYILIQVQCIVRLHIFALEQNIDIENEEKLMEVLQSIRIEFQQGKRYTTSLF